jgi:hypothetical protein
LFGILDIYKLTWFLVPFPLSYHNLGSNESFYSFLFTIASYVEVNGSGKLV